MVSDLVTLSKLNYLFKYADDTTLLSPENSDVDITSEFSHIKFWATTNKLNLNLSKTKELVFHRPSPGFLLLCLL